METLKNLLLQFKNNSSGYFQYLGGILPYGSIFSIVILKIVDFYIHKRKSKIDADFVKDLSKNKNVAFYKDQKREIHFSTKNTTTDRRISNQD